MAKKGQVARAAAARRGQGGGKREEREEGTLPRRAQAGGHLGITQRSRQKQPESYHSKLAGAPHPPADLLGTARKDSGRENVGGTQQPTVAANPTAAGQSENN